MHRHLAFRSSQPDVGAGMSFETVLRYDCKYPDERDAFLRFEEPELWQRLPIPDMHVVDTSPQKSSRRLLLILLPDTEQ